MGYMKLIFESHQYYGFAILPQKNISTVVRQ